MPDTLIIGAGLSGLSAGYHAQLKNIEYVIYEAEAEVGGLCRTITKNNFLFDYSGHLLHLKTPYFKKFVKLLIGENLAEIERNAVIHSNGIYTRYPFQANLYGLPPEVIKECLIEFVKAYYGNTQLPTTSYESFRSWVSANLGEGIGRHFMFPYNEKLWTVSADKMTAEWLGEYVPKPSLDDVFNGAFADQTKKFGYNAAFWYPRKGGIQTLSSALADRVSNIRFNEKAVRVNQHEKTVSFESGREVGYNLLVNTIPLNNFIKILTHPVPETVLKSADALRHNSVLIVNLGAAGGKLTDKHWIYLPEKKFTAYRVGVYSNFSPSVAPEGTTSYYIEIAYKKSWGIRKEEAVNKAIGEMLDLGLVGRLGDILVKHIADVECAYVIYDKAYSINRKIILDYLKTYSIQSIGRYGRWEYSGMEEAMMQGRDIFS